VLPDGTVVTDPDILESFRTDRAELCAAGTPAAVVRPRSTKDVQAVLKVASDTGTPVVPQGARTGLAGGANALDGAIVLSMVAMNQIVELDPVNRLAVVQPGVINADISKAAREHGLRYPPDPSSWEMCTIGGNISTNAGGMCCVKYGVTTEYVLGLEVVLADGEVLRCGRRTAKGVAGYDLTRLFVGSEGTLGVVTEITLALRPVAESPLTLAAVFPTTAAAGAAVTSIIAAGCVPSMLEIIDRTHLRAIEAYRPMDLPTDAAALLLASVDTGVPAHLDRIAALCEGATEVFVATDAAESEQLVAARRLALVAMEQLGALLVDDIAIPRSRLGEFLDGVRAIGDGLGEIILGVVGHAGDGNMHPNIVFQRGDAGSEAQARQAFDEIMELGLGLGGTCTGEHGVGLLKRDWLAREIGPVGVRVHQAIKQALDPRGILNPGKVL